MNEGAGAGEGYRFTRDLSGRSGSLWEGVEGGDLPMPVEILVQQGPDGRYMFTGLRIGGEASTQEITSATLRQIKLGEILAAHFEYFEPVRQVELALAGLSHPLRPRGPDNQVLSDFARTYLTELGRHPRRAMTAAARTHNISRATANRWAAICRDLGLLPGASSGKESSS